MTAMLIVLLGLRRAKPVSTNGPTAISPVAPAPVCLMKFRRLIEVINHAPLAFDFFPAVRFDRTFKRLENRDPSQQAVVRARFLALTKQLNNLFIRGQRFVRGF